MPLVGKIIKGKNNIICENEGLTYQNNLPLRAYVLQYNIYILIYQTLHVGQHMEKKG